MDMTKPVKETVEKVWQFLQEIALNAIYMDIFHNKLLVYILNNIQAISITFVMARKSVLCIYRQMLQPHL